MSKRWIAPIVAASLAVGGVLGFFVTRAFYAENRAKTELLHGTVVWSNEESRRIVFVPDGWRPSQTEQEYQVRVLTDHWEDAGGNYPLGYPTCLLPGDASAIQHRAALVVLHRDLGGGRVEHIAVSVKCLD